MLPAPQSERHRLRPEGRELKYTGPWPKLGHMHRDPNDAEIQFANQIEEELKSRFHRKIRAQFKLETLEDAQKDNYKLALEASDSSGFTEGDRHFSTASNAATMSGDVQKIWAEGFADYLIMGLLGKFPKVKNIIVLMMTPLAFVADYDQQGGKFRSKIIFFFVTTSVK